jgi:sec-independent protein translocase protein TatA
MIEYTPHLCFWTPGPFELIIILIIAVLLFGRKLPEIARSIGKSLTEFKKGVNEAKETRDELADDVRKVGDDLMREVDDAASSQTGGPDPAEKP